MDDSATETNRQMDGEFQTLKNSKYASMKKVSQAKTQESKLEEQVAKYPIKSNSIIVPAVKSRIIRKS